MSGPVYEKNGQYANYPWSREESISLNLPLYTGDVRCERCKYRFPTYYTRSGKCSNCAVQDYSDFMQPINFKKPVIERPDRVFTPKPGFKGGEPCAWGPHMREIDPLTKECIGCVEETGRRSVSASAQIRGNLGAYISKAQAIEEGFPLYLGSMCPQKHPGWRFVSNNTCYHCNNAKFPMMGHMRYLSDDPCEEGHVGWRRTSDGECEECLKAPIFRGRPLASPRPEGATVFSELTPNHKTKKFGPDMEFALANPELRMSKEDAEIMGFSLFRTGAPCRNGHAGWRRVDSGACCDCLAAKRRK